MGLKNELVIKLSAEADASINETLGAARKRVKDLTGEITELAEKATIGFGAFAVGAGLLVKSWTDAAGAMEQYRAKLTTVLKSSAEASQYLIDAVEIASKTPFDVKGVVDAYTMLTVYGQKASEIFPLVGNLAAGMSKDLGQTALSLAKALSGSYEGFERLRNEYGITTVVLKRWGAEVDAQGQLVLGTTQGLEKTRNALIKIIETNFGGAMERQSKTWQGAMSNFGDSIEKLKVSLGNELAPTLTSITRGVTELIEGFNKSGGVVKPFIAWGALLAGGIAATIAPLGVLARTVPGATASISLLNSMSLNYITTTMTGTAALTAYNATLSGTAPAIALVTTSLRAAAAASLAFMVTPLGATLAAIGVIATGMSIGMSLGEKESKKLEKQLTSESNVLQKSSSEWHNYLNALNEANKSTKNVVIDSANVNKVLNSISASVREMSSLQIADMFAKMGMGKKDAEDQLTADRKKRQSLSETIMLIQKIESFASKTGQTALSDLYDFEGVISFDELKKLQEIFGGNVVSAEKFTQRVIELNLEFKNLSGNILVLDTGKSALDDWAQKTEEIARSIKTLNTEMKIFKDVGGFKNADQELGYYKNKLVEAEQQTIKAGAATGHELGYMWNEVTKKMAYNSAGVMNFDFSNLDKVNYKLRSLMLVKAQWDAIAADPKVSETNQKDAKQKSDAIESEITALKGAAEAAKKNNEKVLQDKKDYISKQKDLNQMNLDDEIKANERMLQNKNLEAEQRKEIESNITKLKHDKEVEGRDNTERSLQKELDAVKLMTSGQVKEYDRIIAKIKEKKDAQQITEKQAYGLNKTASESRKTQAEKDEKDSYDRRVKASETYLNLIDKAEDMSNEERLRIIDSLETAWYEMERQRTVTTEQAEDQIKKLIEKRAALEKKIIDANKQAEQELINLRKSALDSDIRKLGDKMKAGQNVEKELYRKLDDRTKLEMKSFETKDDELRKQGVTQNRRDEAKARSEAALYEKQAEEIEAMISDLQAKLPEEQDRLTKMSMESMISSLGERKTKLKESYESATSRADIAQAQSANEPPLKQNTSADIFSQATSTFSASVKDFSTAITQMIQGYLKDTSAITSQVQAQKLPTGIKASAMSTAGAAQSAIQQVQNQQNSTSNATTNTYIVGNTGNTATADVKSKWGGLGLALQEMKKNGYLDSIGGSLSY